MSSLTFFEGPEKKLELVVTPDSASLRSLGDDIWRDVVRAAGADVISVMRNDHCDAYLLSESSLFVFDDYCVMITCGLTTLVDAVARLLEAISADSIAFLVYERKNEHFPERQPTTFREDARRLKAMVPGRALRFGDEHGHYVQMFHTTRAFVPETSDPTIEILMHAIDERVAAQFTSAELSEDRSLAVGLGIDGVLPGFDTSEHVFDPAGYSLNALRGQEYYTLHVTPEQMGSYASFETNRDFGSDLTGFVGTIVELFQPRAFDVVAFLPQGEPKLKLAGYQLGDHVVRSLGGYRVTYLQYYIPPGGPRPPYELPL
ncbi:MAG: S-adenosylmethionine decarboxylase proenzyme [Myxococcales bacterium]|nr:S-adenosylmethionine decarboxylase proenzyme [Myxococcales bacterium]